jgi:hypothetical protein
MRLKATGLLVFLLSTKALGADAIVAPNRGWLNYDDLGFPFFKNGGHYEERIPSYYFRATGSSEILITEVAIYGRFSSFDVSDLKIQMTTIPDRTGFSDLQTMFSASNGPIVDVFPNGNYHGGTSSTSTVIPLPTPFLYDPNRGSLVMNFRCSSVQASTIPQTIWRTNDGSTPAIITLLDNPGDSPTWVNGGLVTGFLFTEVPEPDLTLLSGAGALFILVAQLKSESEKLKGRSALRQ